MQCEYEEIKTNYQDIFESKQVLFSEELRLSEGSAKVHRLKGGFLRSGIPDVLVESGRVTVNGKIYPQILYLTVSDTTDIDNDSEYAEELADERDEHTYIWSEGIAYSESWEIPGIEVGDFLETTVDIDDVAFEKDSLFKVTFTARLKVNVFGSSYRQNRILNQPAADEISLLQLEREHLTVLETRVFENRVTTVYPTLQLPTSRPSLERLLDYNVDISDLTLQPSGKNSILRGFLDITAVYVGNDEYGRSTEIITHRWNRESGQEIPFEVTFEHKIIGENELIQIQALPGKVLFNVNNANSAREIRGEVEILSKIKMLNKKPYSLAVEALPQGRVLVDIQRREIEVAEFVGNLRTEIPLSLEVLLPGELVSPTRILNAQITLNEINAVADDEQVVLRGKVNLWVEYLGDGPNPSIIAANCREISFEESLDFMEISSNCKLNLDAIPLDLAVMIEDERSLRLEMSLQTDLVATLPRKLAVLTECAAVEETIATDRPSMLFYVVQPNDTLWDIARRYRTTTTILAKVNREIDTRNLVIGQKILIPRKTAI